MITDPPRYGLEQPWLPASESLTEWDESFHDLLLSDSLRMAAFETAIKETVRPGMAVLDLGTGTGILAQWAAEAGARHVYGLDLQDRILARATQRLVDAGHGERFSPICGLSFEVELPEKVDVIVSEIMGNIVDNEDCARILADARRRFLRPGGLMLPSRAESYLVPVSAVDAHSQIRQGRVQGGSLGDNRFDSYYDVIVPVDSALAAPQLLRSFDFDTDQDPVYERTIVFPVHHAGDFTGFKGYFIATLSETVALDISGDGIAAGTTSASWKHCFLPIETPIKVQVHDRIVLSFSRCYPSAAADPFRQVYRWQGRILRDGSEVGAFAQDSAGGATTA